MEKLHVLNGLVVDSFDKPVSLRGVNIGGWMNFENFIDGFPGSESRFRSILSQELGEQRASFFIERFLDFFFNEEDVRFLKDQGVSVIRLPLNYRHFESDQAPFEYIETGFRRLEQVLQWCEQYEIYVILDLHAVQGWQNSDWHCDNSSRHSLFWLHKNFQDRFYALWREFARRYRERPIVAAYNVMNEPLSNAPFGRFVLDSAYQADWHNMNRIYKEVVTAIREIDTDKIIILEGDYFSTLFSGLEPPFDPYLVYSNHNYIEIGTSELPEYPITWNGTYWDDMRIMRQFEATEGWRFAQEYGVPLLVSEFGFNSKHTSNRFAPQLQAVSAQMRVYNQTGTHWTLWTYKDVGSMGWIQLDPHSAYMQTIKPVLVAKDRLRTDFGWLTGFPEDVQQPVSALSDIIASYIPGIDPVINHRYFAQAAMSTYTADQLQLLYVRQFADKSENEIEAILSTIGYESCIQNSELNTLMASSLASRRYS